jgi:hypothetical protein
MSLKSFLLSIPLLLLGDDRAGSGWWGWAGACCWVVESSSAVSEASPYLERIMAGLAGSWRVEAVSAGWLGSSKETAGHVQLQPQETNRGWLGRLIET